MRYSLFVASALAIGALAGPIEKRRVVTAYATQIKTVTVYVTEDAGASTATETSSRKDSFDGEKQPESQSSAFRRIQSITTSSAAPAPSMSTTSWVRPAPPTVTSQVLTSSETPARSSETPATSAETSTPPPEVADQSSEASILGASKTNAKPRLTGPEQAYLSSGPEYRRAILYHHNAARANHGADPLSWDSDCEAGARRTAKTCTFQHPSFLHELKQGQNLFATSSDAFNVTAAITEAWYKAELPPMFPYFGEARIPDDVFHKVGHLTQLLWKGTTRVGCVSVDCGDDMKMGDGTPTNINKFTICNYAEPGNWEGQYHENVEPPRDEDDLGSWTD